jgi:Na+-transporting methylmalonyl-CoA/oxaloacetate decarboxylase gamma subunit
MRRTREAWSLVEISVVLAVLLILAIWLIPKYMGRGAEPSRHPRKTPENAAIAVQCRNNLQQIRLAIRIHRLPGEEPLPSSLQELRLPAEILACPFSRQTYWYDQHNGRVQCPTPTHEGF